MRKLITSMILASCSLPVLSLAKMPQVSLNSSELLFIENKGQIKDQNAHARNDIQFNVAGKGMSVFIGNAQLHYQFSSVTGNTYSIKDIIEQKQKMQHAVINSYRVDVTLLGANKDAKVVTEDLQPYFEKYYTTDNSKNGIQAHAYKKITYQDIYRHIDWVLYIKDGSLEYDFIVKPGGNVADIQLKHEGATDLNINKDGALEVKCPMGSTTTQAPHTYKASDKSTVASTFSLKNGTLSFTTGARQGTIVIDPVLTWSTYCGDTGGDYAGGGGEGESNICFDAAGNLYIDATTSGRNNIATNGAYQATFGGVNDGFVAKYNSDGKQLWATYYGGSDDDEFFGMGADSAGNLYVSGFTASTDDVATQDGFQPVYGTGYDAFLVKFDSAGNRVWGTYYGGTYDDYGVAATCDKAGNVYLLGVTSSIDLSTSTGSYQPAINGSYDNFLVKFTPDGKRVWATYYGGSGSETPMGMRCDNNENIYLTGSTSSSNGIATKGAFKATYTGTNSNAFLAQFDSSGMLKWGTYYGNLASSVTGASVSSDGMGNVFMTGYTNAPSGISTAGSYQSVFGSNSINYNDAFLVKFDTLGNRKWATYFGGTSQDIAMGVTNDAAGNIYITGLTQSPDAIASTNNLQSTLGGSQDAFLAKFNTAGALVWSSYYGGNGSDAGYAVYCDAKSNVYMFGTTSSTDSIATPGAFQTSGDLFLLKLNDCDALAQPDIIGDSSVCAHSSQQYYVAAVNGASSYTWTVPSGWTGSSSSDSITVATTDSTGIISVTANSNCTSSATTLDTIVVTPLPNPIITIGAGHVLSTGAYAAYQWYFNGQPVANDTLQTYTPEKNGKYFVLVTDGNGCSKQSADTTLMPESVNSITALANAIYTYPNPVTNIAYVIAPVPVSISVLSIDGRVLAQQKDGNTIDMSAYAAGVYLLQINDKDGTPLKRQKIVKTTN